MPASPGLWWTCRLFLRLVLPYVRHLKGEDDKPLPPSKPRKQYKMAREPRGDDRASERPKKAKEEKPVGQVSSKPSRGPQLTLGLPLPCLSQPPLPVFTMAWPRAPCSAYSVPVKQVVHYLRAQVGSEHQSAPHSEG